MATIRLLVNGTSYEKEMDPGIPLLWALRDILGLTGTKFGCGIAQCGACTVLIEGKAVRSCSITSESATGKDIQTIEGVEATPYRSLQQAWIEEQVPQCGYCQSGQIMNAIGLLKSNPQPTDEEILSAMAGNICRCGTYPRILKAIKSILDNPSKSNNI
ncbi:(2Fe-2S)-binding protein [Poritiphilus flavus]|uniref:2Fe-2S iron-sulfur cluster binding domain-containing protein n=1 Tax=Poritiphilus flavus TaxID=2697053 RepID=A0A6L9EAE7_9FLAO|nr:(2Fe-2S)-binding protein [Poritiphilus flavus]NAS11439.1 2Fe-2S iron-sulfur cluster binding domain-containing protein [Poritiphilus flavus]